MGQECGHSLAVTSAQCHKLQSRCWLEWQSHLRLRMLFWTHMIIGRICSLAAIEFEVAPSHAAESLKFPVSFKELIWIGQAQPE